MTDTRRYTEGKTEKELLEIQKNSVVGGDVHQAVTLEIQRIQQDTNNIQIANLISEIKELKDITAKNALISDQNTQSSNKLGRIAIYIAVATLFAQVVFSTHQDISCASSNYGAGQTFILYQDCYRNLDLGLFGKYSFKIADYKIPAENK